MDKVELMILKIEKVRNLPTLPVVIDKLRNVIRDPNADSTRITDIIHDDPSMMTSILKVVNSAIYRGREPINSLSVAVTRMGLNAVSNIAISTAVFSLFGKSGQTEYDREGFWRHSISTSIAIRALYDRCRPNLTKRYSEDVLHLVGLLHDIGKIVLDQFFHDEFVRAIHLAKEKMIPLCQAESEVMGADHTRVGSWLGMRWSLSRALLQVIRWHHDPASSDVEHRELVMLCHAANYICNVGRIGDGGDLTAPVLRQDVWTQLGQPVLHISDIVDAVVKESKQSEVLMSFVTPEGSDSQGADGNVR